MFFMGGWGYEVNVVIGVYFVFTTTELRVEMILNYIKRAPGTLPVSLRFSGHRAENSGNPDYFH